MAATLNYDVDRYYRHTGRAPIVGTTIATVAAWVAVSLIGIAYAYVQLHVKIVDLLSSLVEKSLVVAETAGAAPRYRLLESTRHFAFEKLAESGGVIERSGS